MSEHDLPELDRLPGHLKEEAGAKAWFKLNKMEAVSIALIALGLGLVAGAASVHYFLP